MGGTWYWNRYPGVMCDVESYQYLPMLEELDYIPTRRYAFGEEIRQHLQSVADRFDLVPDALFHTGVTQATWDDDAGRWTVHTDRGDELSCRYYVLAVGILNLMKLPAIPGMDGFSRSRVPHGAVGLRLHRRRPGRSAHRPRRQGRRADRDGSQRAAVPAAARRGGQARLRVPAHAVGDRGARQPAHRSVLRRRAAAGLAEGPDGQLPVDHAGQAGRRRPHRRRLDAPLRRGPEPAPASRA